MTTGYKSDVLNAGSVELKNLGVGIMEPREFSTGSVGFNYSGKVTLECNENRYNFQISLNITLAHSKEGDPKRVSDEVRTAFLALPPKSLKELGLNTAVAEARLFSTNKVGFYHNGKCAVNGNLCQVGCSITAIGSETWDAERPVEKVI